MRGGDPQGRLRFQVGSLHVCGQSNRFLSLAGPPAGLNPSGDPGGKHSLHLNQKEKGATSTWPSPEGWSVSLFRGQHCGRHHR